MEGGREKKEKRGENAKQTLACEGEQTQEGTFLFPKQLVLAGQEEWMKRELKFEFTVFFEVFAENLRSKLSYCATPGWSLADSTKSPDQN